MATTVFHIEGGIGKNIAATAVVETYKKKYPKRNIIVVSAWPDVWTQNTDIARFYRLGHTPYFYQDVIRNKKDLKVFMQDPYKQTSHITKEKHLIETWCNMVGVKYNGSVPKLGFNIREIEEGSAYIQQFRVDEKPILLFQPYGGPGPDHQQHPYSWTRDIHPTQAQEIVDKLSNNFNIVHVCYEFHPRLNNAHRFDKLIGKKALFSMVAHSDKRLFVDSSLQHAAAALNLPATVAWVATHPDLFGYNIHNNIMTKKQYPKGTIDSYMYDYDFSGVIHECPYKALQDFHDVDAIVKISIT